MDTGPGIVWKDADLGSAKNAFWGLMAKQGVYQHPRHQDRQHK
jgi:hypothetical protein